MRVVLDTNVVVSGLFFGGVPRAILDLLADGELELVLSPAILDEYHRTYDRMAVGHPEFHTRHPLLDLLAYGTLLPDPATQPATTKDSEDDKFMLSARGAGATVISGDGHPLEVSGREGARVLTPRAFLSHLTDQGRQLAWSHSTASGTSLLKVPQFALSVTHVLGSTCYPCARSVPCTNAAPQPLPPPASCARPLRSEG